LSIICKLILLQFNIAYKVFYNIYALINLIINISKGLIIYYVLIVSHL